MFIKTNQSNTHINVNNEKIKNVGFSFKAGQFFNIKTK